MEYIKDYDFPIKYHPGKENVITDALSRKSVGLANLSGTCIFEEFKELIIDLQPLKKGVVLANMSVSEPAFIQKIKDSQLQDPELAKISEHIANPNFCIVDGVLYYRDRLCVSNIEDLRKTS